MGYSRPREYALEKKYGFIRPAVIFEFFFAEFHGLAPLYYHGAHVALLIYDITDRVNIMKIITNIISYVDRMTHESARIRSRKPNLG